MSYRARSGDVVTEHRTIAGAVQAIRERLHGLADGTAGTVVDSRGEVLRRYVVTGGSAHRIDGPPRGGARPGTGGARKGAGRPKGTRGDAVTIYLEPGLLARVEAAVERDGSASRSEWVGAAIDEKLARDEPKP